VSDEQVTQNEVRVASTLFYGILGGLSGAASCCCWPGAVFVSWMATRRAVARGVIEPGAGLSYGLGVGVVMGLVMASLGTAIGLSGLDGPQFESMEPLMAETPLWLLAGVMAGLLGAVGLGSGLLGGLLASTGRKPPAEPSPARTVPRPSVPVPGSMDSNPPGSSDPNVGVEPNEEDASVAARAAGPADFVTAETEPSRPSAVDNDVLQSVSDVEQTLVVEQAPPSGEDELREWGEDESALGEAETPDDSVIDSD
jgi:hypothetical protein